MALQTREYPTILKLKQLEKEMATAINEYKYLNNTLTSELNMFASNQDLDSSDGKNTIKYFREQMQAQISILRGLVEQARPLLAAIIQKGEMNQDIVTFKQKDLNDLNANLQTESDKLIALEFEVSTVERENDIAVKQQGSAFIQGIFMALIALIVIALTVNAIVNPKSNSIETAALVIAIALALYFLYKKYV